MILFYWILFLIGVLGNCLDGKNGLTALLFIYWRSICSIKSFNELLSSCVFALGVSLVGNIDLGIILGAGVVSILGTILDIFLVIGLDLELNDVLVDVVLVSGGGGGRLVGGGGGIFIVGRLFIVGGGGGGGS